MESPDATWAPQSPDLSSYHHSDDTTPRHPQHQGYRASISHFAPYSLPTSSPSSSAAGLGPTRAITTHSVSTTTATNTTLTSSPSSAAATAYMPRGARKEESIHDADYTPDAPPPTSRSRGKRPDDGNGNGAAAIIDTSALLPPTDNIVIKNHFPVARIKRIMQADDDVGKVAQVTPVVVSKALELFMISLVTKAAAEAKARNSKRVGTIHLKQAIVKDEQFDFLSEIVSKIADAPVASDKNEGDAMEVDGKKRKTVGRRKKKTDDDDF